MVTIQAIPAAAQALAQSTSSPNPRLEQVRAACLEPEPRTPPLARACFELLARADELCDVCLVAASKFDIVVETGCGRLPMELGHVYLDGEELRSELSDDTGS